ncbi:putative ABC transporter permease subunit [Clostridium thermarum]|uniref:putative ABC transporter permease subunit n=1 Tax=Clostridium thermarum TaxID=1716543 RepID=UPI001120BEE7|nr:ABC transporter permease [Clostridium thermarum]
MSKLWILSKVLLKSNLSSLGKKKKTKISPYLTMILLLSIFGASFSLPIGILFGKMYDMLETIQQQGALLTLAIGAVSVTIFLFGIFYVLGVFYFSRDVELLLPLPLKPSQILGAKFITVLLYEYLTEAVMLLPAFIAYGIKSGSSIVYYLYSLIIFLLVPIIPLILASLLNMIIMRFTNIGKHKDALRIAGGVIGLAFGIGVNIFMQGMGKNESDPEAMLKLLYEGNNSLISIVSKIFPTAKVASISLVSNNETRGIVNLLLFLVINLALTFIFFIIGEMLYFKGVLGNAEVYSKRKKLSGKQLEKTIVQSSALKAFMMKELKILFRTPSYLMNCVISSFMWPIILGIGIFSSGSLNSREIKGLMEALKDTRLLGIILVALFAMSVVFSGGNGIASTSISREGNNLFISKYLPISFKDQILARIMPGIILSSIAIFATLGIALYFIDIPLLVVILGITVILLGMLMTSFIGILLELRFPKLNWDNEQKAVKQNTNFMITMFASWAIAALFIFAVIVLKLNLWYAFIFVTAVSGILNLILFYLIMNQGQRWFNKIEL